MSHTPELDIETFPLHGSRLIEASAGTGKTWTIAALYLRLVLGHGAPGSAFSRPLLPAEILVMTFTRAATRELSDRIRARLIEAASHFRDPRNPGAPGGDPLLDRLLAASPDEPARRRAAWLLANAAEAMDDAAIFTIDAWCQRMLREHAFDSGNPFDEELADDEQALLTEATQDYWRQHCYPLDDDTLEFVLQLWPDLNALLADMRALIDQPLPDTDQTGPLADCVTAARQHHRDRLLALASDWPQRAQNMKDWLDTELAPKTCDWNRRMLSGKTYGGWLDKLADWARDPLAQELKLTDTARRRLTPDGLLEARKEGAAAPQLPPEFAEFAALLDALARLPDPQVTMRLHAVSHVARRLALLKRQARSFGFADIQARLDRALSGAHGARLRERILTQYPVALIDEFQDTSPLQYRLFDALYRTADNDPHTALLLIGDPKQSIYGFRGADIYSYLQARRATTGRHYMLGTNFRSTGPLVDAVNHCFDQAEARPGAGAFLFRSAHEQPLPFEAVAANGRAEGLHDASGPVPALSIEHDLELRSSGDSLRLFAARCAERIVTWLNDPAAGFHHPDTGFTRLRPADIAVLVRTGREAAAVRRELRRRSVASVYLSDKDSVFASDEAHDLLHWLRAVAAPLDARLVRAALATRTVGLPLDTLAHLASDDEAFDRRSEHMRELHKVWRELGVLTMLRRSLHLLDLPARWLADSGDGERRLTNFLHLAELLQHASATLEGEAALVRWLAMQIEAGSSSGEEQVVRLESDADLVKVVTVFKSKGLEYPVVCLPFPCAFRPEDGKRGYLKLADADGQRELRLKFDDEDKARADHERLREDLRLLYVALTRPRHALWMGFAALKRGNGKQCETHRSALGYLIGGEDERDAGQWHPALEALAEQLAPRNAPHDWPRIRLQAAPADSASACTRLQRSDSLPPLEDSPVYRAHFERRWSLGSFSSLVRDIDPGRLSAGALPPPDSPDAPDESPLGSPTAPDADSDSLPPTHAHRPAADETDTSDGAAPFAVPPRRPPATPAQAAPWHRFPRGALAGDFLHGVLEWLAGEGFALAGNDALHTALRRRCERAGHGEHAETLIHWMETLLGTPLPTLGVPLQAVHTLLPEMEFWLPAGRLPSRVLDTLCQSRLLGAQPRPVLPQRELQGMLMGFADLVFEHQGRYWVMDYKSNALGTQGADYHHTALEAAMAAHRYDVQAVLYLLALHRLLRSRLGAAYEPTRQLGGALYLFLRGIDGPLAGEYALPATPELLALLDTLDQQLADEVTAA